MESYPLTYFRSKSCFNLCEPEFWCKKKWAPEQKFFKKYHLGGRNDWLWPKNDEPLIESCSLTYFQSKICLNLRKSKFQCKKRNEYQNKNFRKKYCFGGRNNKIWLKNAKPISESSSLTHFPSKSYKYLCESKFE